MQLTLFFSRNISLSLWERQGGLGREVALYQRLQQHGVQVRFITYGTAEDLHFAARLPGITILPNRWHMRRRLYTALLPWLHAPALRSSSVLKTNQTDGALVALRSARLWHRPLIARCGYMWSHNVAAEQGAQAGARARRIERQVFSGAQQIVVTTPAMAADVAQRLPHTRERIRVIPNYVDTDSFAPDARTAQDIDLLFIGRLAAEKNLAALLEAVQPLPIRTVLIGTGGLGEALQQQFPASRMHGQVEWLGAVAHADLPHYIRRARIFILPSFYEGHPKTLIEAMACGAAVLGTRVPGIAPLIQHGETGYLCDTSAAALRAAIRELLGDAPLRARLGAHAREYALAQFALERIVTMELAVLQAAAVEY